MGLRKSWTTNNLRELRRITAGAGSGRLNPITIITLPSFRGRTRQAVAMQISRNGWADKIRSDIQRAARTRTWDRDRLDLFLKTDGKCWPSPPVADLFGISRDTVKQHRRKLGLKLNHQECLRDPVYAQWWKAGRANRLRSYEEGMARKREYLRNLLGVRLRLIDLQPQRPKPKKKRCVICGTWWYATPDFFHQKAGGILASGKPRNSYLLNVCLVCPINSKKSRVNKRS